MGFRDLPPKHREVIMDRLMWLGFFVVGGAVGLGVGLTVDLGRGIVSAAAAGVVWNLGFLFGPTAWEGVGKVARRIRRWLLRPP